MLILPIEILFIKKFHVLRKIYDLNRLDLLKMSNPDFWET